MGIILLIQTGVGILENSFLFDLYKFTLFTGHKLKSKDLILNQLVLANSLVLFSKGNPQTMAALGWKYFLMILDIKLSFMHTEWAEEFPSASLPVEWLPGH